MARALRERRSELVATPSRVSRACSSSLRTDGQRPRGADAAPSPPPPAPAAPAPAPRAGRAPHPTSAARRRRRRDGARQGATACTATSRRASTRSAPSPSATRRSSRSRLEPTLTPELQARDPGLGAPASTSPARRSPRCCRGCSETYCGTIAYEIEHISDHEQRVWLRQAIESGRYRHAAGAGREAPPLLARLTEVEGFERYLRRAFLGQKQFSIEGLDVMVPMLDEAIELAAEAGAHEVVIGMAHRGRLNVLAHVVGRPYEAILREFEGERTIEAVVGRPRGRHRRRQVPPRRRGHARRPPRARSRVTLASNPSHLEAVDPVVEGRTRAEQTDRSHARRATTTRRSRCRS